MPEFELIIIGGGPAGLTAGLYACRSRLKTVLLEPGLLGGQIALAHKVENYPGFPQGISGMELGELMYQQAKEVGLELRREGVVAVELREKLKRVTTSQGVYQARAAIIASGSEHRKLGAPGEEAFLGKGVSYCATCDGPLFQGVEVAVIGGGDTAVGDALFLTNFAPQVFLIHRRRELRAVPLLREQALAHPKLRFLWETVVQEVKGDGQVQGLRLRQVTTGEESFLPVGGVFVAIGLEPNNRFLQGQLKLSPTGNIPTNQLMETEIPGVFAAGDIRVNSPRQAIAAAGDGATAAISAFHFLRG